MLKDLSGDKKKKKKEKEGENSSVSPQKII